MKTLIQAIEAVSREGDNGARVFDLSDCGWKDLMVLEGAVEDCKEENQTVHLFGLGEYQYPIATLRIIVDLHSPRLDFLQQNTEGVRKFHSIPLDLY